jgi:hypothetical protein
VRGVKSRRLALGGRRRRAEGFQASTTNFEIEQDERWSVEETFDAAYVNERPFREVDRSAV